MEEEGFYYEFEILDESDYRLILTYKAGSKKFEYLLNKTKKRLEKKEGVRLPTTVLEQFTIPEDLKKHMLPLLTKATKKNVKFVLLEVKKDGIICTNSKVIDAFYNKMVKGDWEIKVFVKGQYRT